MEDIKVSVSSRSYILSYSVSRHTLETCRYVSVSSRSYILSYSLHLEIKNLNTGIRFPSPLGVIFSLI